MPLYAATIFLGAFLLFLVQSVIARAILPCDDRYDLLRVLKRP